ncbi:MAG: RecQ family ATP-dependent DNA helicase [Bacteroidaceae bacterium]|nr:RecQ family ATP-dependent DNA helicase [Bacteroidaceae bacterium]
MSFWRKVIGSLGDRRPSNAEVSRDASRWAFVDVEVGLKDKRIHDIGILRWDDAKFHSGRKKEAKEFLDGVDFICGHNVVHHDVKYLFGDEHIRWGLVDTLYMSPLLFPERPYHHLLKDDKLMSDQVNNPLNDCEKAYDLLLDEMEAWKRLPRELTLIYATLLHDVPEFSGFLDMADAECCEKEELPGHIYTFFHGRICQNVDLRSLVEKQPVELAFSLALITTTERNSITPPWVLYTYPNVENVVRLLRHTCCADGCDYCRSLLDVHTNLKHFFGYNQFRTYEGEPLQENAVRAAVTGKSLLAIFPTGGGKSLTFQLPALMESQTVHGLTVVISPLLSLMKDQVDNLAERGITEAVTINGLLDPVSRSLAIDRVQSGDASLLYIAPEMLRSKTIERILQARHVVRFVIDEAHCFSSWGQDFRVDYLYIGKFIREYQNRKRLQQPIPISCFTATAKQKVIQDICDYFKQTLGHDLQLFASSASRTNLRYSVIHADTDEVKYSRLRSLIAESDCPVIVYVSRTKRTRLLAEKLTRDGYKALAFNGQMDADEKIANQEAFMNDRVRIIVATSAFGMGVDKSDVGLVIHYDISDSLENYVQEAGRAGRDPHLEARCYVLYSDGDLDKHFMLLNQTKLSISEIQQVWRAVKDMTKQRMRVCCSALEIARKAGWDDSVSDMETRVRTALAALEQAGYLQRGNNVPHVYATGITVKNMDEARRRIAESLLFEKEEVEKAVRIIKSLISQRSVAKAQDAEAESRIDYLADMLELSKKEVVSAVERMRQEGILADTKDISAYLYDSGESERNSRQTLRRFVELERYILDHIPDDTLRISCKQFNDDAHKAGITTASEKDIRTLLYFLTIKGYTRKREDAAHNVEVTRLASMQATISRFERRLEICEFAVEWLYKQVVDAADGNDAVQKGVQFSIVKLLGDLRERPAGLFDSLDGVQLEDVEEALLYLSKIGALKLEGGFLVLYNAMEIHRVKDSMKRYKQEDYRMLNEFYRQKIQQVHIVGEYANLMVRDYNAALQYVQDYFQMDYKAFVRKYFKGERLAEISRNITPEKYKQIFGSLSPTQQRIIQDKESVVIVVAAGPGSGKTRVLVHKLASLLLLEDVKHEQLLMLTFSRAAATEFKQRLMALIGNAAHFVEIKTFHSYSFDLLGRIGNIEDAKGVVERAARMISEEGVEPSRICKTVLVIDEAQDMSSEEYALVRALMKANEGMRVIAVGDDDQNIYEFRGSDSRFMRQLLDTPKSTFVEMTENYRSSRHVVDFANAFARGIRHRMKRTSILSVKQDEGTVVVRHHVSCLMYQRIASDLLAKRANGTMCVLTHTNEQAVIMNSLLRKQGLNSKLIQSTEGFRFWNMAEVRFFVKQIERNTHTPRIADEVWENAKSQTRLAYASSTCLPYLERCLKLFEQTSREKFLTDFKEFVFESMTEDFCSTADADVVVSTIHKSKGHEYDDVYLLVTQPQHVTDLEMRRYYVGMTRAKCRLFIYTDSSLFDCLPADFHIVDQATYGLPEELELQLTHKDVNLGFFMCRKREVLSLRAGEQLRFADNYLYALDASRPIAQISKKMQDELVLWDERGYMVSSATIRFVVAWKPKDAPKDEKENAVLLLNLGLKKSEKL